MKSESMEGTSSPSAGASGRHPEGACGEGIFLEDYGLTGDAHAARGIARQVSLLAEGA